MFRLAFWLFTIALSAYGLSWMAEQPGSITILLSGTIIEIELLPAFFLIFVLFLLLVAVWSVASTLLSGPDRFRKFLQRTRQKKGLDALTQGMLAAASRETRQAREACEDARYLMGDHPLVLLLSAETARLVDDQKAFDQVHRAMLESPQTRPLGLRGLFIGAREANDLAAAQEHAQEALRLSSACVWAQEALFEIAYQRRDWLGALERLEHLKRLQTQAPAVLERWKAVLMTAESMRIVQTEPDRAVTLADAAQRQFPDFVAAAVAASVAHFALGRTRAAVRRLERCWRFSPHPELAQALERIYALHAPEEQLKWIRRFVRKRAPSRDGSILLSAVALRSGNLVMAREEMQPWLNTPTKRVCLQMAAIEAAADRATVASRWLAASAEAEPDPIWVSDDHVAEAWQPVTPDGTLDGFTWRLPPEMPSQSLDALGVIRESLATTGKEVFDSSTVDRAPPLLESEQGEERHHGKEHEQAEIDAPDATRITSADDVPDGDVQVQESADRAAVAAADVRTDASLREPVVHPRITPAPANTANVGETLEKAIAAGGVNGSPTPYPPEEDDPPVDKRKRNPSPGPAMSPLPHQPDDPGPRLAV